MLLMRANGNFKDGIPTLTGVRTMSQTLRYSGKLSIHLEKC